MNNYAGKILFIVALMCTAISVCAFAGSTPETRPRIFCEFSSSRAPVDKDRVIMVLDGYDVSGKAKIEPYLIEYIPEEPLEPGVHKVTVVVYDMDGNRGEKQWSFEVDPTLESENITRLDFVAPTPGNGSFVVPGESVTMAVSAGKDELSANINLTILKDGIPVEGSSLRTDRDVAFLSLEDPEPGEYSAVASLRDDMGGVLQEYTGFTVGADVSGFILSTPEARSDSNFYLSDIPGVTSSPVVDVSGYSGYPGEVSLLVNGIPFESKFLGSPDSFHYRNIELEEGINAIQAVIEDESGIEPKETAEYIIRYTSEPVEIVSESDDPDDEIVAPGNGGEEPGDQEPEQPDDEDPATGETEYEIVINSPHDGHVVKNGKVNVNGKTGAGCHVSLFLNDALQAETDANNGGHFLFQHVPVAQGAVEIRADVECDGTVVKSDTVTIDVQ